MSEATVPSFSVMQLFKKLFTIIRSILCHSFIWLLNFIENVHLGAKDTLGTKLQKFQGRIFFQKM